jgi:hypothetical protein
MGKEKEIGKEVKKPCPYSADCLPFMACNFLLRKKQKYSCKYIYKRPRQGVKPAAKGDLRGNKGALK